MSEAYNTRFAGFVAGKVEQYGEKFDASDLNPNFIAHYNKGRNHRIKVRFAYGETKWGTLGVTTGWKPCFILLRNRIAAGSADTIGPGCVVLDTKTLK